jgi:hypothetical protein
MGNTKMKLLPMVSDVKPAKKKIHMLQIDLVYVHLVLQENIANSIPFVQRAIFIRVHFVKQAKNTT